MSALSASGVVALTGSAMAMTAGGPAVDRDEDRGRAVLAQAFGLGFEWCGGDAELGQEPALPSATWRRSTMPTTPLPAGASKSVTRASAMLRSAAAATIALRQRMLARALDAGGEPQHLVVVEALRGHDGDDLRLAFGQRAGLVDHDGIDFLHAFERLGVVDQHAGTARRVRPRP